jgi:hypothetical protein
MIPLALITFDEFGDSAPKVVAIKNPRGRPRLFDLSVPHSGDIGTDLFAA